MRNFKSLQVYLSFEEYDRLADYAEDEGLSNSKAGKKIIREALGFAKFTEVFSESERMIKTNQEDIACLQEQIDCLVEFIQDNLLLVYEFKSLSQDDDLIKQVNIAGENLAVKIDTLKYPYDEESENIEIAAKEESFSKAEEKTDSSTKLQARETNLVDDSDKSKKEENVDFNTSILIQILMHILNRSFLVISDNTGELFYWGGSKPKTYTKKIELSTLYKSKKSAQNTARKASKIDGKKYYVESAYDRFRDCPDDKKLDVLSSWELKDYYIEEWRQINKHKLN